MGDLNMSKITVIGAGSVGATIANDLMIQGIASEIVLIDVNKEKAFGEAMDIYQGAPFCSPVIVRSGDYDAASGSDIVIITSGLPDRRHKHWDRNRYYTTMPLSRDHTDLSGLP